MTGKEVEILQAVIRNYLVSNADEIAARLLIKHSVLFVEPGAVSVIRVAEQILDAEGLNVHGAAMRAEQ